MARRTEYREEQRQKQAPEVAKIPHDPVNEQVIIAACLVDHAVRKRLTILLEPEHFFGKGHGFTHAKIWAAICELEKLGLAYDPLTVKQIIGGDDSIDTRYLDELIKQRPKAPDPKNLAHHVQTLIWDRTRIESANGAVSAFLEGLRDVKTKPEAMRGLARGVVASLSGRLAYVRDKTELLESVKKRMLERERTQACYPFGLDGFDQYDEHELALDADQNPLAGQWRVIPGMAPGQTSVLTGVPGSGKSTVVTSIINAQARNGRRVLYGAWEMGAEMSIEMCACIDLGFSRMRLMTGRLTAEEKAMFLQRVEELNAWITFFEIPFGREKKERQLNDRNLDLIQGYIEDTGCDVAVFDLWRRALRQIDPEEEEIALLRQQAIAKTTGVHCCLLHQQRAKDLEQRVDKRPTRETIKGSGAWIEVPDTILGVHMPALWKSVANDKMEIILLKQRFGKWPLSVEFDYDADKGTLLNGRSVEYTRPGEEGSLDAFLSEDKRKNEKGTKNVSRRTRP